MPLCCAMPHSPLGVSLVRSFASKSQDVTKPMSAYNVFVQAAFRHPDMQTLSPQHRVSAIAKLWNVLPESDKMICAEHSAGALRISSPPKHLNSFALFAMAAYSRPDIQAIPMFQRLRKLADLWKNLPEAEKMSYTKTATACSSRRTSGLALFANDAKIAPIWNGLSDEERNRFPEKVLGHSPTANRMGSFALFVKLQSSRSDLQGLSGVQRMRKLSGIWKGLSSLDRSGYCVQTATQAPNNVMYAFQLFAKTTFSRPEVEAVEPGQRLQKLAEQWRLMSEPEQKPYFELAMLQPKAPRVSAYVIFSKETYPKPEVQALPSHQRLGEVSRMWRNLSAGEKTVYLVRARSLTPNNINKRPNAYALFTKAAFARSDVRALPFN